MITKPLRTACLISLVGITLVGCKPPPTYDVAAANIAQTKNEIDTQENKQYPAPAPVVTKSSAYVNPTKVSLIRPPAWLKRQVTMRGNDLPFSFYIAEALGDTGALIQYDKTVDKKMPVSLDYDGDIRGALDELATKTDYSYEVNKKTNTVTWSGFTTKVFDVSFMPGSASYMVGGSKGGDSSDVDFGFDLSSDDQFSQLSGDVSIWNDLDTTIRSLMSADGRANVSQATTTVTVHDHPANVKAIGRYIKKMNRELAKQVRLHVEIIEVRLRDDFSQGINWNLVHTAGQQFVSFTSPSFNNTRIIDDKVATGLQFLGGGAGTPWLTSDTIIQNLAFQGNVQVVNKPTLTTLNNQVAQLSVQNLENYISEITNTLNDSFSQASVETQTISTGTMVYLLPKIQDQNVFLQVSTNLSVLLDLATQDTGLSSGVVVQTGTDDTSDSGAGGSAIVQLPKVALRTMNQRAVIPSGKCLVITGFKNLNDETGASQLFGFQAPGSLASSRESTEIVMLITPTILSTEDSLDDEDYA